jgi:hypothetical protein
MIDPITVLRAQEAGLPAAESNPDVPLVCFPLRADWEQVKLRENHPNGVPYQYRQNSGEYREQYQELLTSRPTFPIPTVTSDDPVPEVMPGPVAGLLRLAESKGWTVLVTYSKGHEPHATYGTPSAKPKAKWALRMINGDRRAVAVRTDDAWSSFWDWAPDQFFQRAPSLAAFERVL